MSINISNINTENRNFKTINIDKLSTLEMMQAINNEDKIVAYSIEAILPNIALAVDAITKTINNNGRLIYIGAGTSGRLGVLDASECPPTFGTSPDLIQGIIAGGISALTKTSKGAEDNIDLAIEDLNNINLTNSDIVCGIAASGRTPYVIAGIEYSRSIGCKTIGIATNSNSDLEKICHIPLCPNVGAEAITGSTRMKSGTAQKMILNMLSTGAMIKLGKVYSNLMVDFEPSNEKLIERAKHIIMESTGVDKSTATEYFKSSENNTKLAILMIKSGLSKDIASKVLDKNNGILTNALNSI